MTEDFLHHVWKFRLFNSTELYTTGGEKLSVISPGVHNRGGGPDFLNARLRIGGQLWAGHVEIHLKSGDWHAHRHTDDPHYKNVILHAVYTHDREVNLYREGDLPVLVMAPYIIDRQLERWQQWLQANTWIPCQARMAGVDAFTWNLWKERLAVERLEQKCNRMRVLLDQCRGDWNEAFFRLLAKNFGFAANAEAMEMLAGYVSLSTIRKLRSDPFQLEALLFGQAGFLEQSYADDYPAALAREFAFLKAKFALRVMPLSAWNFGRIRPGNFPTVRIAQLAAVLCRHDHLFQAIIEAAGVEDIHNLFTASTHPYWKEHFRFDVPAARADLQGGRSPGVQSRENVLINTVSVALFTYGRERSEPLRDKAMQLLESCGPEANAITDRWKKCGVVVKNAVDSQALLQLYKYYCTEKKCLNCQIGVHLLRH